MSFIPNTDADRTRMLEAIGVAGIDELFADVPAESRYPRLDLPLPVSEMEALVELEELARRDLDCTRAPCFLGAGAYRHFIPSVVDFVVSRSEFSTAYTPYQPEISQGTLQAIFEYQTMIARLTGMEVSNASHYDGATAAAEAVLMSVNVAQRKRTRIVLSPGVHPQYREVVRTYTQGMGLDIRGDESAAAGLEGGAAAGAEQLAAACDGATACVVVQSPDFFGRIVAPDAMRSLADRVVAANPVSLGLLVPPGETGADIVVGDGQPLGSSLSFGGPALGFFAFRREHIRKSSGRISGETTDREGRRGYVFTLNTREQHIRREKATSNICTNQSLNALSAAVHLAALGPRGLRRVAELCWQKAHHAADRVARLPGWSQCFPRDPFFNEFAVRCPRPVAEINHSLKDRGIIGGYDLGGDYPQLEGCMLLCCTETSTKADIDRLVEALKEASHA
jgi:glycine dehydrogenase subunit 1